MLVNTFHDKQDDNYWETYSFSFHSDTRIFRCKTLSTKEPKVNWKWEMEEAKKREKLKKLWRVSVGQLFENSLELHRAWGDVQLSSKQSRDPGSMCSESIVNCQESHIKCELEKHWLASLFPFCLHDHRSKRPEEQVNIIDNNNWLMSPREWNRLDNLKNK